MLARERPSGTRILYSIFFVRSQLEKKAKVNASAACRFTLVWMNAACFLCLLFLLGWNSAEPPHAGADSPGFLSSSTQIVVVTTKNWDAVEGRLQRYERSGMDEAWRRVGEPISIVVGRKGMGWGRGLSRPDAGSIASDPVKREGDGKSPAGIFTLGTAFGYASQPLAGLKMPYLNLTPTIECVDDPGSKHYNRIVDSSVVPRDWNSSEQMRSFGESYRWGILVGHNRMLTGSDAHLPEPGAGSCIFLHIWQSDRQGTAGCTAMADVDLESLLIWLDPTRKPVLVQLPEPAYENVKDRWRLP